MKRMRRQAALVLLAGFLLGIRDGKLALWLSGEERPVQVYDILADSLPPADRLELQRGLELSTREELWQILENYLE